MERRELRHDRHTLSLLTDHTVFSPKYRGKILVGSVTLALDGIIHKTCKDLNIEIIDMAVNDTKYSPAIPVAPINAYGRRVDYPYFRKHLRTMLRHKKDNSK